jgi:hypothetical protein
MERSQINLFHILVVAPLLLYVGYNKGATPEFIFTLLIIMAVLVLLYHGYRYLNRN